jgi:hypothetical protein
MSYITSPQGGGACKSYILYPGTFTPPPPGPPPGLTYPRTMIIANVDYRPYSGGGGYVK